MSSVYFRAILKRQQKIGFHYPLIVGEQSFEELEYFNFWLKKMFPTRNK